MMKMKFKSMVLPPVVGSLLLTAAAPLAAALLLSPAIRSDCAARTTTTTSSTTTRLFATDGSRSSSDSSTAISSLPRLVKTNGSGAAAAVELSADEVANKLTGKRVAYYFGAGWCPMCTSFEPSLLQFRQAAHDSGKDVELIYVPSDRSMQDAVKRCSAALNIMCMVPFGDEADKIKNEYKIWAGSEALKLGFGAGRRSGVPALVVLNGENGNEMAFLPAESQGVKALQAWPMEESAGVW